MSICVENERFWVDCLWGASMYSFNARIMIFEHLNSIINLEFVLAWPSSALLNKSMRFIQRHKICAASNTVVICASIAIIELNRKSQLVMTIKRCSTFCCNRVLKDCHLFWSFGASIFRGWGSWLMPCEHIVVRDVITIGLVPARIENYWEIGPFDRTWTQIQGVYDATLPRV